MTAVTVDFTETLRMRATEILTGDEDTLAQTHDGLALALGERWRDSARYVDPWKRWYFWDGPRWIQDDRLQHMTETRAFLRAVAEGLPDKDAKRILQAETVAKVVGLARSNPDQVAGVDIWDADPWLLGTPGGTVELRTGQLRPARPGDYITKLTAVTPAPPGTPAPLWSAHLDRITDGDEELVLYLQRFAGYALTGCIREHAFVFGHGGGANGKGVTLNTLLRIGGDYAVSIPTEMLMVSQGDRHPTELARLRGVRLAIGQETEDGKRWAEAKIKSLTGGDTIAARFMRQNYFEFEPQFKLFVVGNRRPSLRGVDEAMRRRFHLFPFEVTIPPEERDPELSARLEQEWPAILRWCIDGCLAWQGTGLRPPTAVLEATENYLEAEDAFTQWAEECCDGDPGAWEPVGILYAAWKQWAEAAGEYSGSKKRFSSTLEDRGFQPKRGTGGVRGYLGLRLKDTGPGELWQP